MRNRILWLPVLVGMSIAACSFRGKGTISGPGGGRAETEFDVWLFRKPKDPPKEPVVIGEGVDKKGRKFKVFDLDRDGHPDHLYDPRNGVMYLIKKIEPVRNTPKTEKRLFVVEPFERPVRNPVTPRWEKTAAEFHQLFFSQVTQNGRYEFQNLVVHELKGNYADISIRWSTQFQQLTYDLVKDLPGLGISTSVLEDENGGPWMLNINVDGDLISLARLLARLGVVAFRAYILNDFYLKAVKAKKPFDEWVPIYLGDLKNNLEHFVTAIKIGK
ncbi:MAG: hypothetical protein ACE5F1_13115 [Planctomycetota bacterium]